MLDPLNPKAEHAFAGGLLYVDPSSTTYAPAIACTESGPVLL
jgi:hypothetical protein